MEPIIRYSALHSSSALTATYHYLPATLCKSTLSRIKIIKVYFQKALFLLEDVFLQISYFNVVFSSLISKKLFHENC